MTHASEKLFSPVTLGAVELSNRMVMAPLTRVRAGESGVPNDLHVEYYSQRASLGLIVTEGTFPILEGRSWIGQPGIETAEQIAGWRRVADAVHAAGGRIVLQIMHGGRISHPSLTGTGRTVAPSAIAAPGEVRVADGSKAELPVPAALTLDEIRGVVDGFVTASRNAIEAGLDGVEIHSANGYLVHQFLATTSNTRTDAYGGSPANRARLSVEILTAVAAAIGADRTGLRISPEHNIQGVIEDDAEDLAATYTALAEGLAPLGLAFVDILHADPTGDLVQQFRKSVQAPVIVNSGFGVVTTRQEAFDLIEGGHAEAVAIGRPVIANPDLAVRWARDAAENAPDASTFYGDSAAGYTDYPTLD
ncbi:alkene reductase [Kineosporia succinea]|uniref:2,4-dienoyl-CoA reductase-like NADH-dependent reductase (Old Yellow Enzyme family) n=1 Tax=Kineosporia succinea TaxID=84632 RepID=A0ABT9P6V5_9ACTN|nr:alkene reductase [Kineosporia succinea]MDP9828445.1 2,4-dienoyl-CoA reductase-like NADH-dependent reductase (Old Yellow Enzyme family) [Kineosporia succinea]